MRFRDNYKFIYVCAIVLLLGCEGDAPASLITGEGGTGQGGSMSRFAVRDNNLYVLDLHSLHTYDIGNGFVHKSTVDVPPGMETIFVNGDFLYLGATDAMYIYSITNRTLPEFAFRYQHIVACDPVVVQGNRAYVTMRAGTRCNMGDNALEILDITDPYHPTLIANHAMLNPHGLAVAGDLLFICEGEYGIRMFDISDEASIDELYSTDDHHAYDVIVRDDIAIVTGDDGIFQYRFTSDGSQMSLISKINVNRPAP